MQIPWKRYLLATAIMFLMTSQQGFTQTRDVPDKPRIVNEPVVTGPDSLLPRNKRVRMVVQVDVDSTGVPKNPTVIWSTDRRFDALARGFALQYRFERRTGPTATSCSLKIPMVFMNPPIKKVAYH